MRFDVTVTGSAASLLERERQAGERAVTGAMRWAGAQIKTGWRGQVTGAGLGTRLANTIRDSVYPKGQPSLNAAATIWTRAPDIMKAHEGSVIRSAAGFFLAIPTANAGRGARGARMTPGDWEKRTGRRLRYVYVSAAKSLLVDDGTLTQTTRMTKTGHWVSRRARRNVNFVVFTLVPQVRLPRRLNVATVATAIAARVPGAIVSRWRA